MLGRTGLLVTDQSEWDKIISPQNLSPPRQKKRSNRIEISVSRPAAVCQLAGKHNPAAQTLVAPESSPAAAVAVSAQDDILAAASVAVQAVVQQSLNATRP